MLTFVFSGKVEVIDQLGRKKRFCCLGVLGKGVEVILLHGGSVCSSLASDEVVLINSLLG